MMETNFRLKIMRKGAREAVLRGEREGDKGERGSIMGNHWGEQ
jgi:hypothetical protein